MRDDYRCFAPARFAGRRFARRVDAAAFDDWVLRTALAVRRDAERVEVAGFRLALAGLAILAFVVFLACLVLLARETVADLAEALRVFPVLRAAVALVAALALRALAARTAAADRWTIENRTCGPIA